MAPVANVKDGIKMDYREIIEFLYQMQSKIITTNIT